MPDKRPSSTKMRRECFEAHKWADPLTGRVMLTCWLCKLPIDPTRDKWDAEHSVRRALNGDDSMNNVLPAHEACHDQKTPADNSATAKGKRVRDKHFNIRRRRGFQKPDGFVYDWSQGRYVRAEEVE